MNARRYFNLNDPDEHVDLQEAVLQGLGRRRGLFFPAVIPTVALTPNSTLLEVARIGAHALFDADLPKQIVDKIVEQAFTFDAPVVPIAEDLAVLELFHGPTFAFKDFGARFLAALLGYYAEEFHREITVLVATSGDTGSAVAQSFLGQSGIRVILLYPSGRVSHLQEQQLTTAGQNVHAIEVLGSFDDCQRMVKDAFADKSLTKQILLTSANSINLARLLPQAFYYLYASVCSEIRQPLGVVVPSGNLGNLCAGLIAQRMGAPIKKFIAATNLNSVVPEFLSGEPYSPRASIATLSNAMDVGDPSNFPRLLALFANDPQKLRHELCGVSISEAETISALRECYRRNSYLPDPHCAVGLAAWEKFKQQNRDFFGLVLATAHPGKFFDVIKARAGIEVTIPAALDAYLRRQRRSETLAPESSKLIEYLQATH